MAQPLSDEQMRAIAAEYAKRAPSITQPPQGNTLTPEQMFEAHHQAFGGIGHEAAQARVAAMMPPAAAQPPPDLAPPLPQAAPEAPPLAVPATPLDTPLANVALGEMQKGRAEDAAANAGLAQNAKLSDQGFADEQMGLDASRETSAAKAQALEGNDAEATRIAADNEAKLAEINARGQAMAQQQMVRLNAAVDASQHAEVHDFWQDKSTGARILGILSQAFAGAANGLANNPGAITPLDRVISADLSRQQINLEQQNKKVDQARSVLSQIYQDTGSAQQAQAGMYIAAWKRVTQAGLEIANKFKTPEAQAQFEQLKGLSEQRQAQATEKAYELAHNSAVQQFQHGADSLGASQAANSPKALTGENERIFTLAGTTGEVDNRTYEKLKDSDQAYRAVSAQQNHIAHVFRQIDKGKLDQVKGFAEYKTARADLLSSMRKMQGTGAALSTQELANVEALLPDFATANAPGVREFLGKTGAEQMRRISATTGRRYFSLVNKTIKGVTLNPNDSDYGDAVKTYLQEKAAEKADQ